MGACGCAHHSAHELTALGHEIRLIPPRYLKPYVKRTKNSLNDAEAICEATGRPGMHFVPVKSATKQAQGTVLKVPESLVGHRTLLIKTLRGHAAVFGMIAAKGLSKNGLLLAAIDKKPPSRPWPRTWPSGRPQLNTLMAAAQPHVLAK